MSIVYHEGVELNLPTNALLVSRPSNSEANFNPGFRDPCGSMGYLLFTPGMAFRRIAELYVSLNEDSVKLMDIDEYPFVQNDNVSIHGVPVSPIAHTSTDRGNNAFAFKDTTQTARTSASSPVLNFVYKQDPTVQPTVQVNVDAARTNAFYIVNTVHDIMYRYAQIFSKPNIVLTRTLATDSPRCVLQHKRCDLVTHI